MAAVYKSLSSGGHEKESEGKKNKQRVLVLSSRGVTYRHRHLLQDLYSLMPHSRKEAKLDTKTKLYQLNELAELYNCNNVLFFEARKGKDLYCWMAKAPNGPTVKMHLQNLHTMEELNFIGNCLKGSRPILSFDAAFEKQAHLRLMKELFTQIFGVPKTSRKTKPFVDHVMSFTVTNNKVWIRLYQINESEISKKKPTSSEDAPTPAKKTTSTGAPAFDVNLVEIGPRFVLTPIVIQESSFGGPIIYENKEFVSPNQIRSDIRKAKAGRFNRRSEAQFQSKVKRGELGLASHGGKKKEKDPLSNEVLFA
ncbi:ribosome biogenesis protein-like protein Brx1 [Aaosphaeria arxii CBS 175.79]|uniref:Ribosome biogenesis protein-like protein Brx1 n=1 Tax=Aaosphaeria arxii CBS 175.79 TaxID=1450172 RepID=A0A6A5XIB1_9PLEO|nr:ribosome biogenesis protein-like protein Brx1 [Aaosphaeria arxii CBS 175.79]KAF2012561.1 ribosome biogenesis protein-like protein Brx1 [Aaosphaeria arxii CBS 175.79]